MGIKHFGLVFLNNFIVQVREFKRNLMLFLIPIFIFAFINIFFPLDNLENSFMKPLEIGVIDNDSSVYSDMLMKSFESDEAFSKFIKINIDRENVILKDFYDNKYDAIITIPKGFADSLMYFGENPVEVKVNYKDPISSMLLKNSMEGYDKFIGSVEIGVTTLYNQMNRLGFNRETINSYNAQISFNLVVGALKRTIFFEVEEIQNVPTVNSQKYFMISIIIMFLMYISVFAAIMLMKEREEMCIERVKITDINMVSYILAKAMSITLYIFLMVIGWVFIFYIFTNSSFKINQVFLGIFIFLCILFDVSIAVFVSSVFEKEEAVVLFSNVFVFINAIIGGSIVPLHYMPETFKRISIISPNYWMIKGMLFIDSNYKIYECVFIALVIGLLSLSLIIFASKRYNREAW